MAGSGLAPSVPALLISRLGPPSSAAAAASRKRCAGSVTSPGRASTGTPRGRPAAAVPRASPSLASMTSAQPSPARPRASARPRPLRPMVLGPRADPGGPGLTYRRGVAKHSERDHRAQLDELVGRLSTVVLAVARQTTTRDVLQVIVSSARSLADARYAALGVPDDRGSFAEFVTDGIPERQRRAIGPLPRQHGMLGVLLREGRPVRLADIRADP